MAIVIFLGCSYLVNVVLVNFLIAVTGFLSLPLDIDSAMLFFHILPVVHGRAPLTIGH